MGLVAVVKVVVVVVMVGAGAGRKRTADTRLVDSKEQPRPTGADKLHSLVYASNSLSLRTPPAFLCASAHFFPPRLSPSPSPSRQFHPKHPKHPSSPCPRLESARGRAALRRPLALARTSMCLPSMWRPSH